MTAFPSTKWDKASCEKWYCRWSDHAASEKKVKASAGEHYRRTGHAKFDVNGYHVTFRGER